MILNVVLLSSVAFGTVAGLTIWGVLRLVAALENIAAAVRGQVVKPVSLVPPSWGKRH